MSSQKINVLFCITVVLFELSICHKKGLFTDEKFASVREECLEENSMTIDDLKSGWHLDDIPQKNLCFHRCMMLKTGLIDADGLIQEDYLVAEMADADDITDERREQIIQCMKDINKIESCEDAHKVFGCRSKSG